MTNDSQVCHVVLEGCISVLFLRIKYAALTIEHNVHKGSGMDLLEGAGKEGSIASLSPTGRPAHMVEAPLLISALPSPYSHLPIPIQSEAPSAVSPHCRALLFLLCNSQLVFPVVSCS